MSPSLAMVYSRAKLGIDAPLVCVETHLSNGLPSFNIVGLPEAAVKESKDRVRSALLNSYFEFPARRITVNLAPADLPKDGGRFDLAIALGILAASEQIPSSNLTKYECLGELALSGELRPISSALPSAMACADQGRALIISSDNALEAALAGGRCYAAHNLLSVCAHLHRREAMPQVTAMPPSAENTIADLADVKGQLQARRALEIAAAGLHNLLLYGPPGTGKTMLASRLAGILPPLNDKEALQVAAIYSAGNGGSAPNWRQRPFRNPHHSASAIALVGGGSTPQPGEITLAHKGVLFLDELPEFPRSVLEVLREPMENGEIRISRARAQLCFPARFQLIAAMNPCPCGHSGSSSRACSCNFEQIKRYRDRISGPLLDRIDLQVPVNNLVRGELQSQQRGESSATVAARVKSCLARQYQRQGVSNAELGGESLAEHCCLTQQQQNMMETAMEKLGLSARAFHRTLKVARTLADLTGEAQIQTPHLNEALSYRMLDRG
jgi:magnesium chelatase family protein